MARAGQTGALTASYQTFFDASVDGGVRELFVRNTGGVSIQVRVTPLHRSAVSGEEVTIPANVERLFRSINEPITLLELKGNTGTADFGCTAR
jgi:hypothetical protein